MKDMRILKRERGHEEKSKVYQGQEEPECIPLAYICHLLPSEATHHKEEEEENAIGALIPAHTEDQNSSTLTDAGSDPIPETPGVKIQVESVEKATERIQGLTPAPKPLPEALSRVTGDRLRDLLEKRRTKPDPNSKRAQTSRSRIGGSTSRKTYPMRRLLEDRTAYSTRNTNPRGIQRLHQRRTTYQRPPRRGSHQDPCGYQIQRNIRKGNPTPPRTQTGTSRDGTMSRNPARTIGKRIYQTLSKSVRSTSTTRTNTRLPRKTQNGH